MRAIIQEDPDRAGSHFEDAASLDKFAEMQ
jgi:hypothetical protein